MSKGIEYTVDFFDTSPDKYDTVVFHFQMKNTENVDISASLSPGIRNPYATYDIRVEREGFFVHENRNAPVFSGIYSIQNVDLIPLSPYGGDRPPAGSTDFSSEQSLNGGT